MTEYQGNIAVSALEINQIAYYQTKICVPVNFSTKLREETS